MPHCPNCGNVIDADSAFCPFCGTAVQQPGVPEPRGEPSPYRPPPAWGYTPERVNMGEVLSASWRIITQRPILLLPHLISAIVSTVLGVGAATMALLGFFGGLGPELTPLIILSVLIVFVISTVIEGIYPLLTKQVMDGDVVDLGGAAGQAVGRFFSILGAAIMVFIITMAGGIPFILGVLFVALEPESLTLAPLSLILILVGGLLILYITIWYYCAVPALMLENRSVFDALSASKAFSNGKKWTIFGLMLFVSLASSIVSIIVALIPVVGVILVFLVGLFFTAYASVIRSYLYLRYSGALHVTPTSPVMTPTPSYPVSPPPETSPPTTRCPTCGAEVGTDQTYCGWCGSKL